MSLFVQCGFYWQKYHPFLYIFVFAGGGETPIWQKLFNLVFLFSPDTPVFIDAYVWVRLTALEFNAPWFSYSRFQHKKVTKFGGKFGSSENSSPKLKLKSEACPCAQEFIARSVQLLQFSIFISDQKRWKLNTYRAKRQKKLSFRHSHGL